MTEKLHAKFSASGSKRWLNCPGSAQLIEKAPPQIESPYAKEGTDAHTCVETLLKNPGFREPTAAMLRKKYPAAMVADASRAVDEILKFKTEGAELLSETEARLDFVDKGMFGTADAVVIELFGTLTVIDFKYGAGVSVDPKDNPQLIYYALGVAHQYDYNFERIRLVVIQPRIESEFGPVREWSLTVDELTAWTSRFTAAVVAAKEPNAPRVAGDHCRFCPAAVICPELSTRAFENSKVDFMPEIGFEPPVANGLDPDHVSLILDNADKIETWLSEIRSHAFRMLSTGQTVPGYKLVPKRAVKKWHDAEKVEAEAKKIFGDIAFDTSLKSPAQLEKVAADAPKWVEKRVVSISSGLTLAPESDKREATIPAQLDFKNVVVDNDDVKPAPKKAARKQKVK